MALSQTTIALVFDYDQTLSPQYMQNEAIFTPLGIDASQFWTQCNEMAKKEKWDAELAYLKCFLDILAPQKLSNEKLRKLGEKLTYFKGVKEFFETFAQEALTPQFRQYDIKIEYYIVSSGLQELLNGCSIAPYFKAIFGCEFSEKENHIDFPKRVISHTTKTQFLFRINKGLLSHDQDVNDHMPSNLRPIPFSHMIYIGDGPTDVPCFALMKRNGGHAIAVYNPNDITETSFQKCFDLNVNSDRVRHVAPADFTPQSQLYLLLKHLVTLIGSQIIQDQIDDRQHQIIAAPKF